MLTKNVRPLVPAIKNEVEELEKLVVLPNDYKQFLTKTDGMHFFESSDYSLFGGKDIQSLCKEMNFKKGVYPIGYILEDYVIIKGDEISTDKYIYVGDSYCSDGYFSLNCNFETFLENFIISNGSNYWRWQNTTNERFDFIE